MQPIVVIQPNKVSAVFFIIVFALLGMTGFLGFALALIVLPTGAFPIGAALMAAGGAMVIASVIHIPLLVRLVQLDEPVIEMSPKGFLDRRTCRTHVAWRELEWKRGLLGAAAIHMKVSDDETSSLYADFSDRLRAFVHPLIGLPTVTVHAMGLGCSPNRLLVFLRQYKPKSTGATEHSAKAPETA